MSTELTVLDSGRDRKGSVLEYISPSRLNLWLKCPLAFRLRYLDGIESQTTPSLFVGKMTHRGLEILYRHRQIGVTLDAVDVISRTLATWESAAIEECAAFESVSQEQTCRNQVSDLVTAYLGQLSADEPNPLAVETTIEAPLVDPVSGEDLGIPLLGIVDLILPGEYGPIVVDFKTSAKGGEILEVTHEIQLSCYAYLLRTISDQPEERLEIRSLIKTKSPRVETHRYEPRMERHFQRLFAVVRAYLDDLGSARFVYRPGPMCGGCDLLGTHCRQWCG